MRLENEALLRHLCQPVEHEAGILQVVEEAEEEDEVEALLGRQAVGVDVCVDDLELHAELPGSETRLIGELLERLDEDDALRATEHHLDREETRVAADVERRGAAQVGREVALERIPAIARVIGGRLTVAGPDPVRQLEVLVPPAEGTHLAFDLVARLRRRPAAEEPHAAGRFRRNPRGL